MLRGIVRQTQLHEGIELAFVRIGDRIPIAGMFQVRSPLGSASVVLCMERNVIRIHRIQWIDHRVIMGAEIKRPVAQGEGRIKPSRVLDYGEIDQSGLVQCEAVPASRCPTNLVAVAVSVGPRPPIHELCTQYGCWSTSEHPFR